MSSVVVKNTLAFLFPEKAAQPSLADMGRFVKALNADQSSMEAAYKISDAKSVFIRFNSETAMTSALENNEVTLPFHYSNGKQVFVRMSVAGGNTRYVRVFDLPPEISDADLSSVMQKYGKVKRTVRERFPAEYNLDMYTGVRGVYMDIEKEIPEILYFHNRKGRLYYEGIKPRCYVCKSDAHLKNACPVVEARRGGAENTQQSANECELQQQEKKKKSDDAAAPAAVVNEPHNSKQHNNVSSQKSKKSETKRQRSPDSNSTICCQEHKKSHTANSCSSDSESSMITVSDASPVTRTSKLMSYEWIEDAEERRRLMEEDKQRIAEMYKTTVDKIKFIIK